MVAFVPFVVILHSGNHSSCFCRSYGQLFNQVSTALDVWIANSQDTTSLAPFIYGTESLGPGISNLLYSNRTTLEDGWCYHVITGSGAGTTVAGQDPCGWLE